MSTSRARTLILRAKTADRDMESRLNDIIEALEQLLKAVKDLEDRRASFKSDSK